MFQPLECCANQMPTQGAYEVLVRSTMCMHVEGQFFQEPGERYYSEQTGVQNTRLHTIVPGDATHRC